MITPITFKTRFPEFTTTNDTIIQTIINEADLLIANFGKLQDVAMNYLTAHLLTVNKNQSSGKTDGFNQVASKTVGAVSVSYGIDTSSNSFYSSTSYGQMYLDLKKRISKGNARII